MKCLFTFLLIVISQFSYSQITYTEITKVDVSESQKPPPYDSLLDFQSHLNGISDYKLYVGQKLILPELAKPIELFSVRPQFYNLSTFTNGVMNSFWGRDTLMTYVYKPCFPDSLEDFSGNKRKNDGGVLSVKTSTKESGNKYYTIVDVLYGKALEKVINEMENFERANPQKIFQGKLVGEYFVIALRDDETNDTAYFAPLNANGIYIEPFILVSYFIKQKNIYSGKPLIAMSDLQYHTYKDAATNKDVKIMPLSKWMCDVTLLKNRGEYGMRYVLRNSLGETVIFESLERDDYSHNTVFVVEDEYLRKEQEKRLKHEEMEARKKKDELDKAEKVQIANDNHLKQCIFKYGDDNGKLIANGKVKIGMSDKMCLDAWGRPYDTKKVTEKMGTFENWYYGYSKSLHFENGVLTRIEE